MSQISAYVGQKLQFIHKNDKKIESIVV